MQKYTIKEISFLLKNNSVSPETLDFLKKDERIGVNKLLQAYYTRLKKDEAERARLFKMTKYERQLREEGFSVIAGIDEAGRGPLAGPVVASAVILPVDVQFEGLNDSKKMSPQKRDLLFEKIEKEAVDLGIGIISAEEIDRINVHKASLNAMKMALESMYLDADYLLVDGFAIPGLDVPQKALPKGDALSLSIAAASVVAKVTRDRIMLKMHHEYPEYGFDRHKGYGTAIHMDAIERCGLSPEHRRSFCSE